MSRQSIQIISSIIFAATLTVAVLGFSLMGSLGHMMAGCFGAGSGSNCSVLSPIQHFESHINAFQNITGVVVNSLFSAIALLFIALTAIPYVLRDDSASPKFISRDETENPFNSSNTGLLKYLTFHENSPSFT